MIYINKKEEHKALKEWKKKFKNKNRRNANYIDITNDYNAIHEGKTAKELLKSTLINEQKGVCCYCCNRINQENSHIEHFRPKSRMEYQHLSLDYTNLHASCQGIYDSMETCGHNKHGDFDEERMISPLEEACEEYFEYDEYGEVYARNQNKRADYTIRTLNLNDKRLCKAREIAIQTMGILDITTKEEKQEYYELYSEPDANGNLEPFYDAITYLLSH